MGEKEETLCRQASSGGVETRHYKQRDNNEYGVRSTEYREKEYLRLPTRQNGGICISPSLGVTYIS